MPEVTIQIERMPKQHLDLARTKLTKQWKKYNSGKVYVSKIHIKGRVDLSAISTPLTGFFFQTNTNGSHFPDTVACKKGEFFLEDTNIQATNSERHVCPNLEFVTRKEARNTFVDLTFILDIVDDTGWAYVRGKVEVAEVSLGIEEITVLTYNEQGKSRAVCPLSWYNTYNGFLVRPLVAELEESRWTKGIIRKRPSGLDWLNHRSSEWQPLINAIVLKTLGSKDFRLLDPTFIRPSKKRGEPTKTENT